MAVTAADIQGMPSGEFAALADGDRLADLERQVLIVNVGHRDPAGTQKDRAFVRGDDGHRLVHHGRVARHDYRKGREAAGQRQVFDAHLRRAILAQRDPAVAAHDLGVDVRDGDA